MNAPYGSKEMQEPRRLPNNLLILKAACRLPLIVRNNIDLRLKAFFCNSLELRQACFKKHLIGSAKPVSSLFPLAIILPLPPAAAPADVEILTLPAVFRLVKRILTESALFPFFYDIPEGILPQIPDAVLVKHIEIAGVYAAVRFDHTLETAHAPLFTCFRRMPRQNADIVLKHSDIGLPSLIEVYFP